MTYRRQEAKTLSFCSAAVQSCISDKETTSGLWVYLYPKKGQKHQEKDPEVQLHCTQLSVVELFSSGKYSLPLWGIGILTNHFTGDSLLDELNQTVVRMFQICSETKLFQLYFNLVVLLY